MIFTNYILGKREAKPPLHLVENHTLHSVSTFVFPTNTQGKAFSPDGTILFTVNISGQIKKYTLETGYDITDIVDSGEFFNTYFTRGLDISPDGSKIFIVGNDGINNCATQINLPTPFSLVGAEIGHKINLQTATPVSNTGNAEYEGIQFTNGGHTFLICKSRWGDYFTQFNLTEPYKLDTATLFYVSGQLGSVDQFPVDAIFYNEGYSILLAGNSAKRFIQLNVPNQYECVGYSAPASYFDITNFGSGQFRTLKIHENYIYFMTADNKIYKLIRT